MTDAMGVRQVLERYRPQVVFHAAAYKHVPLLEDQVEAAVRNNVVGSAGSVVPRFQRQIEGGGPVTVTHPDIERFFMTIPEACQLIMQAAAIGDDADTFVLDMGEPVKIRYLAEQMILLSGRQPGRDIRIEYIGLRPGEKLYEDLFYPAEIFADTPHPRIHIARQTLPVDRKHLAFALQALHAALEVRDRDGLVAALKHAVPAWECSGGDDYYASAGQQRHTDGECLVR